MKDERAWVTVPMPEHMRDRIQKAAAKNDQSRAEYLRMAITDYMMRHNEWSLPGPRKGSA